MQLHFNLPFHVNYLMYRCTHVRMDLHHTAVCLLRHLFTLFVNDLNMTTYADSATCADVALPHVLGISTTQSTT